MPDLPITLDRSHPTPLREQLVSELRGLILAGTLATGDELPSSRALAAELGIARGTVTSAFDQLLGEGYLEAAVGVGTRVAAGVRASSAGAGAARDIRPVVVAAAIDARPGYPAPIALDSEWKRVWRSALAQSTESREHDPAGEFEFRAAIANHVRRFRGFPCDAEDVIVTGGSSDAFLLIALALGTGSVVAVENPGYPRARSVFTRAGLVVAPVDASGGHLDVAALARLDPAPAAALVTPSHHYPLGGTLPLADRLALLDWARATGGVVIEDDYDSEFRHVNRPLPAIASLDASARVALVGSFSKVLSTRLRCGYVIARGELGERLRATREELDSPVSVVQQLALAEYLESGGLARSVARARRQYAHRRSLIVRALGSLPGVSVSALDGGLHAVVLSRVPLLAALLADRGILVEPLARYWADDPARPHHVVQLAQPAQPDYIAHPDGIVLGYGACSDLELGRVLDEIRDIHA